MATATKKVKVQLIKSLIGSSDKQKKVVKSLGLSKLNQVVEHYDSATIRGMINKVSHLVKEVG
ncbi:MAG: 50S ribosomal protein L30 [Candidatus Gastranaerophilales bacterium]|nr:50S ribosomal protein L30 [Candidatus Gastranaerophilales bacterium]